MEPVLTYAVAWAVPAVLGFLLGFVIEQKKSNKAYKAGMKVILRKEIVDAYEKHCVQGCPLTVERRREIDEVYKCYVALGGNGTAKAMYEEICKLDIYIVSKGDIND